MCAKLEAESVDIICLDDLSNIEAIAMTKSTGCGPIDTDIKSKQQL